MPSLLWSEPEIPADSMRGHLANAAQAVDLMLTCLPEPDSRPMGWVPEERGRPLLETLVAAHRRASAAWHLAAVEPLAPLRLIGNEVLAGAVVEAQYAVRTVALVLDRPPPLSRADLLLIRGAFSAVSRRLRAAIFEVEAFKP